MRIGHEFETINNHTTYSFGIDDQEFMTVFECDEPADFMHLMARLRESEASTLDGARHAELRRPADGAPRRARPPRRRRRPRRSVRLGSLGGVLRPAALPTRARPIAKPRTRRPSGNRRSAADACILRPERGCDLWRRSRHEHPAEQLERKAERPRILRDPARDRARRWQCSSDSSRCDELDQPRSESLASAAASAWCSQRLRSGSP